VLPAVVAVADTGAHLKVSPLARRVAAERGVDLRQVRGSGPNGRILRRDVTEASTHTPATSPVPPAAPAPAHADAVPLQAAPSLQPGASEVVPLSKMRTVIAQRLVAAKQSIPHFYEIADIDLESMLALRERLNTQLEKEKVHLSVADFIARAVAMALVKHPNVNAHFDGTTLTRFADVNLGIAVALPDGLIVPVLRGVNHMGLREIRVRSADLIDRARQQRLRREELTGATFTISNLGSFGIRQFIAIVNPPEVGILAIGAGEKRPVVHGGQVCARSTMTVTLSADHRIVDGALGAEFLATLKAYLEEPGMMLL
jgi:pyruvate dehydrogenase E2 component (dihydrolipoamide acetyltransferase)